MLKEKNMQEKSLMNRVKGTQIYSIDLHNTLLNGRLPDKEVGKNVGVYLLVLRVLKKDSNTIIYSYVYYPQVFIDSLLVYVFSKSNFKNSYLFREWGDFYTMVDEQLCNSLVVQDIVKQLNEYNEHYIEYINSDEKKPVVDYLSLFDLIKKTVFVQDIDTITHRIDMAIKKNYSEFFTTHYNYGNGLKNIDTIDSQLNNLSSNNDMYILKDCLFIVRDKDLFLNKLKEKKVVINGKEVNYVVNRGPKGFRDQLNTMTSFLSCLDDDYRNNLYKHHLDRINTGVIPNNVKLPRSKFTFRNIHNNIGTVKYYSTFNNIKNPVLDKESIPNRQQLFQGNYDMVREILEKNYNLGSEEVQKEIEVALRSQENNFSRNNIGKMWVKFNNESFDLIELKISQLIKLLSYPDKFTGNSKFHSTRYIPLVKKIIEELGSESVANSLMSYFMEIVTKETVTLEEDGETPGISTITAFNKFGKRIVDNYIYSRYVKSSIYKSNGTLSEFKNYINNELKNIYDEEESYAMIGGNFVWNLITVNLLTEVLDRNPENTKETVHYLRIVQDVRSILINNNTKVFHLPQKLPMVCEPKDYVYYPKTKQIKLGGYLLNDVYYTDEMIKDRIGYGEKTRIKDKNIIVKLVNGLSKTPYKINIDTLYYIYKYGIEKKIISDDSNEDLKNFMRNPYKGYTKQETKDFRSLYSKILMERNILSIADTFSDVEKIYFPVRLDFRTRIYCKTDYFDYQKSDLAKGLILFSNPGLITKSNHEAIKYFKAYGANMYGHSLDKKSLNYRVKWIDDNSDKILDFEHNDIVDSAENKVCFISFCFEYKCFTEFMNNIDSTVFYSHLPIQLDATCNGYQHLAMLTKESKLLSKLNLDKSTHDDDPSDFYTYILDMTRDYIKTQITKLQNMENKDERQLKELKSLKVLKKIDLSRSIIKKVTMRESYSAGITRLVKCILEDLTPHYIKDKKVEYYTYLNYDVKIDRDDIVVYVKTLKRVAAIVAPKVKDLSKYLNTIVNICTRLGMPVPWVLPSGAEILESYLVEKDRKINAFSFTRSKYTFKKYLPKSYDLKKQMRGIRPNLIHSLDATTIAMLYNDLEKIDLYTVHDCFAVTANNVSLLLNKLKAVYMKLYSSNSYLLSFDKFVRVTINNTFGDNIFGVNDKYVKIPVNDKIKKYSFPDITKIISLNSKENIDNIKKSSYPLV